METTLHQQLKLHYAGEAAQTEVQLGRYRIDAVRGDELIEVQCASLSAIRDKCQNLLKRHQLRVVKPVIIRTRINRLTSENGKTKSRRLSPKRGSAIDLFDELIYFTRVFPHPNLTIEVPLIHVEQIRVPSRKKRRRFWHKDYRVKDVIWESTEATLELNIAADLLSLLPSSEKVGQADPSGCFNTAELAKTIGQSRQSAQQIAYVLRKTGAIDQHSRDRTGIIYRRAA
ncbi:hypothetical protein LF1_50790 [Rubripirellula obstinata]|uniref:DUF8091 domain-containing protein n=1 Tax=Rubripirellula obstinata TaxID=406547 RepID=A0A5B1CTF8_9BACT|nr:hypothetical protein [Rubripirellula obstinata]KAA1262514.1 hypothetical protein LF1_50790 [Rubripirellula obstinata]